MHKSAVILLDTQIMLWDDAFICWSPLFFSITGTKETIIWFRNMQSLPNNLLKRRVGRGLKKKRRMQYAHQRNRELIETQRNTNCMGPSSCYWLHTCWMNRVQVCIYCTLPLTFMALSSKSLLCLLLQNTSSAVKIVLCVACCSCVRHTECRAVRFMLGP